MTKKPQIQKFRETARALESDEDEAKFDAALNTVARHKIKPPPKDGAKRKTQKD